MKKQLNFIYSKKAGMQVLHFGFFHCVCVYTCHRWEILDARGEKTHVDFNGGGGRVAHGADTD